MFIGLLESVRTWERSERGMATSVAVHAAVIGLAWYVTAGAVVVPVRPPTVSVIPMYHDPDQRTTTSSTSRGGGASRRLVVYTEVLPKRPPVPAGPITIHAPVISWDSLVAGPNDVGLPRGNGSAGAPRPDADGVFKTVDVMAEPDPRNPPPVYPDMLRGAGIQGQVSAQFVLDTTGRVIASTIAFASGDNALFQQSVRRALEAARFRPALVNGRAVRVLMAQLFQFRLER